MKQRTIMMAALCVLSACAQEKLPTAEEMAENKGMRSVRDMECAKGLHDEKFCAEVKRSFEITTERINRDLQRRREFISKKFKDQFKDTGKEK